jgi:hypothetical protein
MPDPRNPSGFPYEAARQMQGQGTQPLQSAPLLQSTQPSQKRGFRFYWYIFRFSAIVLFFPFARYTGCMASQADRDRALQMETAFHQQMQHGDADGIYNISDAVFQNAVPRARHVAYMAWIARNYGSPVDCTQRNTGVKYTLESRLLRSQCVTSFSNGSTGVETFVWKKTGDDYRLYHYDIKSQ